MVRLVIVWAMAGGLRERVDCKGNEMEWLERVG